MTNLRTKRVPTRPAEELAAPERVRNGRNTTLRVPRPGSTARRFPIVDAAPCRFEIPAGAEKVEIDAYDTDLQRLVQFSLDASEQSPRGDGRCSIRVMIDNATRCIVAYEVVPLETCDL